MNASPAMPAMIIVSRSSCFCSGVLSASVWLSRSAMWPISVSMPVPVTIISPRPRVTAVFMNAMQRRSPSGDVRAWRSASVVFGDGDALAGERGLLDLERGGHEEPTVGRHAVARLDQHDVARHQLARVDLDRLAVAAHAGDVLHHLLQRGQAGLGLGLLAHAQHRVEDRQADQHERRADLLREDLVDDGRAEQDHLHEVVVLAQERLPARLLLLGRELVGAVLRRPLLHLGRSQPLRRVDLEPARHLVHRGGVPRAADVGRL